MINVPPIINLDQVHSSIISASIVAPFDQATRKVDLISKYLALNADNVLKENKNIGAREDRILC